MKELEISSLSAVEHILLHRPDRLKRIRVSSSRPGPRLEAICAKAREAGVSIERAGAPKGDVARDTESVTAWVGPYPYQDFREFLAATQSVNQGLVLVLDHLQDPQNFGALCRTAEALGVIGIVIPKDRSAAVSPGVYHSSVGAVETIPIVMVTNLTEALRKLKEETFWIVGTTLADDATDPDKIPTFEKIALVLGAELEGLSQGVEAQCDWKVRIPLKGRVQSLNVSVAGGILIHFLQDRLTPETGSKSLERP